MQQLFISDLHLHESRPEITKAFFSFLATDAIKADELYIMGDFFEVWIGDDDDSPFVLEIISELSQLHDHKTKLFVMHGNRDFLYGEQFCTASKAVFLEDPSKIKLANGQTALLMHGDSLCTDDIEYIAFREQARNPVWQQQLLSQPLNVRRQLADQLRAQSKSMTALKASDIMDVNHEEVLKHFREYEVTLLIHGHTHRPKRHDIFVDDTPSERIVLGDWGCKAWALEVNSDKISLKYWNVINP